MKKLMIAMSAATMAALYVQAAIPTGYTSYIDFENTATGNLNVQLDDTNTQDGTDLKFWASAAASTEQGTTGQVESQIVDGSQIQGSENTGKFLKVDETVPLQRSMAGVDANGIPTPTAVGDGIEISSSVQFTAADEAPTADRGDKLLVWAKAPTDGDTDQNIYICITDGTATKENPYIVTKKAVQVDTWYDLKIVAKVGGSELEPVTMFDVIVDGDTIATDCKSMVTTGDAATTISSIGFQGTGAVDDIGFKSLAAAGKFTVSVTATGTTDFGMGDNMDREANYTVGTQNVQIYVGTKLGEVVSCNIEGADISKRDAEGYVTVTIPTATIADKAKVNVVITVTAGSGTKNPEIVTGNDQTVQAAVDAANSETGIVVKNCTASDVKINGTSITVGTTTVTIPAYYTANFDATGSKITLTLNENALEEETAVSVGAANLGLTISTSKEKLYYGLATSTTVDAEQYTAPKKLVKGTGNALTLTADKNGNACFYRLYVTDIAPTAAN